MLMSCRFRNEQSYITEEGGVLVLDDKKFKKDKWVLLKERVGIRAMKINSKSLEFA